MTSKGNRRKSTTSSPFGVDYYPEHWPGERWDTTIDLMRREPSPG